MAKKHLVTGATGFTGFNLAKRLANEGEDVVGLDIKKGYGEELEELGVEVILGSASDRELVDKLVRGVDYIHHVAAAFREINLPKPAYWDANVKSNRVLIEAAKKHGIQRYLLTSTCGVHGHITNPPADENAAIEPRDYYQVTKYEGEKLAKELCTKYEIPFVVTRPAGIYGPGDTRMLRMFKAIDTRKFFMLGNGKSHYHLVYIDNLVDACLLCTEKKEALGQTYLIADGECYTLNELAAIIADTLEAPIPRWHLPVSPFWAAGYLCEIICTPFRIEPPLFRRRVDFFVSERYFNISKAKQELGYEPKIDVKTGVKLTAEWYKERGYL